MLRAPRPRGFCALGFGGVVTAALLAGSISLPVSEAQPTQPTQPAPELRRAKELYQSAEAAMKNGRFEDAARDYGAAYELSRDPALFYKIGRANERAGKCDVALTYYARYLSEGKPTEQFAAATKERITACGGNVQKPEGSAAPVKPPSSASSQRAAPAPTTSQSEPPISTGSQRAAATGRNAGSSAGAGPNSDTAAPAQRNTGNVAGSTEAPAGTASGSAAPASTPSNSHKVAWLLTGSAVALATLGGVLAYAASSAENDVRDLYTGLAGQPPTFDAQTKQRYDDLVNQGRRYQHLSWASFGLAGATAAGAAVLFLLGGRNEGAEHARITPMVTTNTAGVALAF
jgi:hypothetical protein